MSLVIVATPGAADANSYLTLVEAQAYFESRLPLPEWDDADSQDALLVMATRVIEALFSPSRKLVRVAPPNQSYYITRPTWTGSPATATQALAWPRLGMLDRNGNAIAVTVVPQVLKEATAELAGQLAKGDRTADNDAAVQGITSIKAGSVALTFKSDALTSNVIPDFVLNLLVPSWLTDELYEPANPAFIDVVSRGSCSSSNGVLW